MEQQKRQDVESSTEPWPVITQTQFVKEINVDTYDRFAFVFFILNTLHNLENSNGWYCYCSENKAFWNKIKSKGVCPWFPSPCQICIIPEKFYGFDSFQDKIRFNMKELRRYYDRLQKQLIKCYFDSPRSTENFLGENTIFGVGI